MKTIEIKELKIGDIFIDNDMLLIVDNLIIKDYGIIYVVFTFLNVDGRIGRTFDVFDNRSNVIKISI